MRMRNGPGTGWPAVAASPKSLPDVSEVNGAVMAALVGLCGPAETVAPALRDGVAGLAKALGGGVELDLGALGFFGGLQGAGFVWMASDQAGAALRLAAPPPAGAEPGLRQFLAAAQAALLRLREEEDAQKASLAQIDAHRDEARRVRRELDSALDALPHGLILFDAEDRIILCNDKIRQIFPDLEDRFRKGERHIDILSEGVRRGVFPEAIGKEASFIDEVSKSRKAKRFERLTELQNGRMVRVIEQAIPSGGRVGLRIDVTQEHEAAQRFAAVIAGSQAGTWDVDLKTGANIVNDRWAEMLGHRLADILPITTDKWKSFIHPDDLATVEDYVAQLLRGERQAYDHTYRMRHAKGHWIWITDRGRISALDRDGKPSRMSGVHIDVSALKAAEERLEEVIEGAAVATWRMDARTYQNEIDDRWAEMLGYRREELMPMGREDWLSLVHPEDAQQLLVNEGLLKQSGPHSFQHELRLRHKEGHWVWVLSRGKVTAWDADGIPLIMSGLHMDISDRKALESELQTERDFLAQVMETSVSGIMAVDAEGKIVFCNTEVSRLFEMPLEHLIGQVCAPDGMGIIAEDGQPLKHEDRPYVRAMTSPSGVVQGMRLCQTMPDGRSKVFSINAARTQTPHSGVQVVMTITDMTAAAEAEAELRAARERAEAANRAKSQFLANMSHELRTPLNGVLGMADLLAETPLAGEQAGQVQAIRDSASLLLSIVNDILDLSKVESGALKLESLPVDLTELVRKMEVLHGVETRRKGLLLEVELAAGLNTHRQSDPLRLLQIMHNLLGNAVKFTESGWVRLRIEPVSNAAIRLCVSDSGIGMNPEEILRVFEEFTQADGTITRRFGGTGLGLSIVRRLVELMGGSIGLESRKGLGTTVTIDLPMPVIAAPAGAGPQGQVPAIVPPGLVALVAEDNRTNQIILGAMLKRLGVVAEFVEDGERAVQLWQEGCFDLLLLDISMPGKDGLSALREMRDAGGAQAVPPAIAVTANAMTHHIDDYLAAGFAAVVAKPLRLDDLAGAISRAVAHP